MFQITSEGKVLVVGTRAREFETELLANPKVEFWHSEKRNSFTKKDLPKGVELVLFGRFLSHSQCDGIKNMAKNRGVQSHQQTLSSNEIEKILEQCLGIPIGQNKKERRMETEPVVNVGVDEEKKKRLPRGAVSDVVRKEADFEAEDPKKEVGRLFELIQSKGVSTRKQSVASAFYRQKTKKTATNDPGEVISDFVAAVPGFIAKLELVAVAITELQERNLALERELAGAKGKLKVFEQLKKILADSSPT